MAPSGLAVSVSGSASGDIAIPVHVAPPGGAAAFSGAVAPGGSAVSGTDASARTAQSPRSPPLAPPTDVQEVQTPGEAAEKPLPDKCPEG
eukprot:8564421-Pyramimonas_sp.AAC.1